MSSRIQLLGTLVAGVAVGAIAIIAIPSDDADTLAGPEEVTINRPASSAVQSVEPDNLQQSVEALSTILDQEIAERQALAEELAALRAEFDSLDGNLKARVEDAFQMENQQAQQQARAASSQQTPEQRLLAAGFTQQQLTAISRLESRDQMRQIEIDDQARREGWLGTERYTKEVQALIAQGSAARRTLSDADFDRYLYAQGRPNRVVVQSVIETSPAERAGFLPGDVLVSYGGQRIFSNQELTNSRSTGTLGENVIVEILRDGRPMRISLPRGPMGITGGMTAIDPSGE